MLLGAVFAFSLVDLACVCSTIIRRWLVNHPEPFTRLRLATGFQKALKEKEVNISF
jgi:hypothetical protein